MQYIFNTALLHCSMLLLLKSKISEYFFQIRGLHFNTQLKIKKQYLRFKSNLFIFCLFHVEGKYVLTHFVVYLCVLLFYDCFLFVIFLFLFFFFLFICLFFLRAVTRVLPAALGCVSALSRLCLGPLWVFLLLRPAAEH